MSRRQTAWAVLVVWLAAVGWLVQREYLRPHRAATAEGVLLISPSAQYFRVTVGDRQVGFASTTVDTVPAQGRQLSEIRVQGAFVTEQPAGGTLRHTEVRTFARLTRLLQLQSFSTRVRNDAAQATTFGYVVDDSVLLVRVSGKDSLRQWRVSLGRPLLLSTLMPLRLVFGREMAIGNAYDVQVFDPMRLEMQDMHLTVQAESTFLVADSARHDSVANRWYPARTDTVRAWKVASQGPDAPIVLWLDELGQVVHETHGGGFTLDRQAFELAFENFRKRDSTAELRERPTVVPSTMVEANVRPRGSELAALTVRWTGLRLAGLGGNGRTQVLTGDTVRVMRATAADLAVRYRLPVATPDSDLAATLLIQRDDPSVVAAARVATSGTDDPRLAAERLTRWMHEQFTVVADVAPPFASRILAARRGDASQLAELYVALARSIGLPARTAAGLIYIDGRFYVHAWAEVRLNDWVPVDPTLGQFPADAAHLRLATRRLARPLEVTPLIGNATITVLGVERAR